MCRSRWGHEELARISILVCGSASDVGLGWRQSLDDLERLLGAKRIEPPYVLVAWSFGGPIARLYAARHPDDVVGMVLVDTDPEDYRSLGDPFVPVDIRERSYWASENEEQLDLEATLELVRAESSPGSFGDRPLVILTPATPNSGDLGTGGSQGLPGVRVAELDALYLRLQEGMKELSSNARLSLVEDTGHWIQCDQPQIVIDAVREVTQASGNG